MDLGLSGRTAIVCGASSGIGLAIAETLAEEGANVSMFARRREILEREAERLGALAVRGDLTNPADLQRLVDRTLTAFGGIDILVNNAAIFDMAPVLEVTEKSFDAQFAVNVRGLFFTLQAAARHMVERGRGGKIINMASQAGRRGEALVSVYCATKAAVISITQSAGLDLIKHRINVNGIAPGVVDTPMWEEVDALFARYENRPLGEKKRLVGEAVPYGRMGRPEDHAGAAVFLASDDAEYVVAQTLNVDGGNWMS
jgi:NAD(P)-dependent dehydrogenase (short-subunit alcohol dehydrogenase family)